MNNSFVFIDTNIRNDDGSYYLDSIVVEQRRLSAGDKVIAYQDSDMWDAEIIYNGNWGVRLLGECKSISKERCIGHLEGFSEGMCVQILRTKVVLRKFGISEESIEKICKQL